MSTCVMICTDDKGAVTVGLGDPPADASDMQPAKSVGDALAMARHLLTQPQTGTDSPGQTSDGTQTGDEAAGGPSGTQPGNGMGGGTGPDAGGSTVSSTQDTGAGGSKSGQPGDAQAMWDALAQMNMPQN